MPIARAASPLVTLSVVLGSCFGALAIGCASADPRVGAPSAGPASSAPPAPTSSAAAPPTQASSAFALDASFGDRGIALVPTKKSDGPCYASVGAVAATADAIYLAGTFRFSDEEPLGGCDAGVMKVLASGKLDPTFGKDGVARLDEVYGFANALAIGPDGKITAAGAFLADGETTEPDLSIDLHFAAVGPYLYAQRIEETALVAGRFTAAGALDGAFGAKGALRFRGHPGMLSNEILLGSDGTTTIVGSTKTPQVSDEGGELSFPKAEAFAMRIGANGKLDATFGEKGVAYFDGGKRLVGGFVSRTKDGKYVFVAEQGNDSFLLRLTPAMKLDTTYGDAGYAPTVAAPSAESYTAHVDGRDGAVLATLRDGPTISLTRFDENGARIAAWAKGGTLSIEDEPPESNDEELVRRDGAIYHFVQAIGEPVRVTRIDPQGRIDREVSSEPLTAAGTTSLALVAEDPAGAIVVVSLTETSDVQIARYRAK
ncbi:MAG: hypothetical protein U0414_37120 [Polyangiaceae bacterium]